MIDHAETHDFDMRGETVLVVSKRSAIVTSLGCMIAGAGGVMKHVEAPAMAEDALASLVSAGRAPSSIILDAEWGGRSFEWMVKSLRVVLDDPSVRLVALLAPADLVTHERLTAAGFDCCLPRPVQERRLLESLTGKTHERTPEAKADAVLPLARVLVADDDPVNTSVAVMMLERLGCVAHTVSTGQQAVDAVATTDFDLILMDCSMPDRDGYDATMEIRATEGGRVPIIASTASASSADRERCSRAGMDEHLAKPFDLTSLRDVLARWIGAPLESEETACTPSSDAESCNNSSLRVFDYQEAIARVGGNRDAIKEVLGMFLEGWPELHTRLVEGLSAHDVGDLHIVAHRIKSTAGCLGAERLASAARAAETDWSLNRFDGAAGHVESLNAGFDEFRPEAERFQAEPGFP